VSIRLTEQAKAVVKGELHEVDGGALVGCLHDKTGLEQLSA
jgi:hypothetical protein